MGIPTTFTNFVPNPLPTPSGSGIETRRNLIPNPTTAKGTTPVQVRWNELTTPSFEDNNVYWGWSDAQWITASISSPYGVQSQNRAVKLKPTGAGNDSYLGHGAAGTRALGSIADGESFRVTATITVPSGMVGSQHARARRIVVFTKNNSTSTYTEFMSAQAPNVPGTYTLSVNATVATGTGVSLFFRLYNGSNNAADEVYYDSVMVQRESSVAVSNRVEYFDGSFSPVASIEGDRTRSWAGVANNSVSVESVFGVRQMAALGSTAYVRHQTAITGFTGGGSAALGWTANGAAQAFGATVSVTLPAATQYTFSVYVYRATASAPSVQTRVAGPGFTTAFSSVSTPAIGAWTRITQTFMTVTAGTYVIGVVNGSSITAFAFTNPILIDGLQLETGAVPTSLFHGESNFPNFSYNWIGTPYESASTETGLALPFYVASNATGVAIDIAGKVRMGVAGTSASTDSKVFVEGGPGAMRMGMVAGKTYYLFARSYQPAAMTGTANATNARNVTFYAKIGASVFETRSVSASTGVGTTYHQFFFTVPVGATEAYISLNNGHPTGGGTIYWDTVMLTESEFAEVEAYTADIANDVIQQTTPGATGVTVSSTNIANQNWVTLTPSTASNDSYTPWSGVGTSLPFVAGNQYRINFDIRVPAVQTGTLHANARKIVVICQTTTGPVTFTGPTISNIVNTVSNSMTFTVPANMTSVQVRLYNGAATGGGLIHYNKLKLTDLSLTDYSVGWSYFDGDSRPVFPRRTSRWLGAPSASKSQFIFKGLLVEGDTSVSPPRVILTPAGLGLNSVSQVTIRRRAGGEMMYVPAWDSRNVVDIGVGVDWLVPLNTPVEYQLWVDGAQIDSETIEFPSPCGWIADPLIPGDALPVYTVPNLDDLQLAKAAMAEKTYDAEWETARVIGSRYPIARAGSRTLLQGLDLTLNAPSNLTSDALHQMIEDAPILVVRTHPSWGNMPPVLYFACKAVEQPLNRQTGGQFTVWQLTGDAVAPITRGPTTATVTHAEVQASVSGRTHQSIKDVSSSKRWADILADPLSLGG